MDRDVWVVWGDPSDRDARLTARRTLTDDQAAVAPDGRFAALEIGPVPVSGPVLSRAGSAQLVVLADRVVPDWVSGSFLGDWGWRLDEDLPEVVREPFQVDALVVASNWAGSLDGWSSSLWLECPVRPMQRLSIETSPGITTSSLDVRVLDVGADAHGVGYAVFYCPDRGRLDEHQLLWRGWRQEPGVRVRRRVWADLASLSDAVEAKVSVLFGRAIVATVEVHDADGIQDQAVLQLPADVRDALEDALADL